MSLMLLQRTTCQLCHSQNTSMTLPLPVRKKRRMGQQIMDPIMLGICLQQLRKTQVMALAIMTSSTLSIRKYSLQRSLVKPISCSELIENTTALTQVNMMQNMQTYFRRSAGTRISSSGMKIDIVQHRHTRKQVCSFCGRRRDNEIVSWVQRLAVPRAVPRAVTIAAGLISASMGSVVLNGRPGATSAGMQQNQSYPCCKNQCINAQCPIMKFTIYLITVQSHREKSKRRTRREIRGSISIKDDAYTYQHQPNHDHQSASSRMQLVLRLSLSSFVLTWKHISAQNAHVVKIHSRKISL